VEERVIGDNTVTTEVKENICGLKRRTFGFLVHFLVGTIGAAVIDMYYFFAIERTDQVVDAVDLRDGDDEKALPIQIRPTSAPIIPW
jgi:hypothetical protein